jgi:hypothetical protein
MKKLFENFSIKERNSLMNLIEELEFNNCLYFVKYLM